jgi:hypothetical protein
MDGVLQSVKRIQLYEGAQRTRLLSLTFYMKTEAESVFPNVVILFKFRLRTKSKKIYI